MKKGILLLRTACLAVLLLAAAPSAPATDKKSGEKPTASLPYYQVRIDVLMVSMPEGKFITLLPDLLDKDKIEKTVPELLEAVKRKEMILEGFPIITTKSGNRAIVETFTDGAFPDGDPLPPPMTSMPSAWEPRHFGVTLEVEPILSPDARQIDLNVLPLHDELLEYNVFPVSRQKSGTTTKNEDAKKTTRQPVFYTMKTTTSLSLRSGRHMLLAVHKKEKPAGCVEIFIIHAEALLVGDYAENAPD